MQITITDVAGLIVRLKSPAGINAINGPKLGMKLSRPAIIASVSISGMPIIHRPMPVSTAIKKKPNICAFSHFFKTLFISFISASPSFFAFGGSSFIKSFLYKEGVAIKNAAIKITMYRSLLRSANIEQKLIEFLDEHAENVMVVMGAYGRNVISRLFKPSLSNVIINQTQTSLFIAHN
jgi:hypothetical protein